MGRSEDLNMLETLLEYETLDDWEKEAFAGMRDRLSKSSAEKPLTKSQREKVEGAWRRLGLDEGASNLWSSGKIPRGKSVRLQYEDMPKPLKPPGRQ